MISQTAKEYLDELIAEGLSPTPRDIIRLNAIGLQLEAARARRMSSSTYFLPRVAVVSDNLFLREPTVGHDIWLNKISFFIDPLDDETRLAVTCFALSRAPESLPDPDTPHALKEAVEFFASSCSGFTRRQLRAAVRYVECGADPTYGEKPHEDVNASEEADDIPNYDIRSCIALGVLNEGRAVLWGVSESDMMKMTKRHLADVIRRAYHFHDMNSSRDENEVTGDFYATLDEIAARLRKEKESKSYG